MIHRPFSTSWWERGHGCLWNHNVVIQVVGTDCGVEDTNISADTSNPDFINPPFPQVVIQIGVLEGGVTVLIEFVDMGIVMMLIKPAADLAV